LVATLASFLGPFMGSSVNVALPSMGRDLGLSAVLLGWVNMAFLLSAATLTIPFGRLGDIYGRKRIYMGGVVLFTAASVGIAVSTTGAAVIVGRVLQGLGASMIFATGMAILISVFPVGERGRVLGINVAAVYLGLSTGPFVGGLITEHLGWRFIFWMNLPTGLLLLAIIFFMLKGEWSSGERVRFDAAGSAILGLSLLSLMYGFSQLPSRLAIYVMLAGAVGMFAFVWYETKTDDPLIEMGLFRTNTVFAFSNLAALIHYAATFAVGFLLSLYLQSVRALSPQDAGLVLISQPVVQAVLSPAAGRLSDRVEPRTVASVGMGVTLVGLVLLVLIGPQTGIGTIVACLACVGVGFALFSSPNTNAIMSSVDHRMYGVASAMVGTMRQLGMTLSMGIVMMILALNLGQEAIAPANLGAFIASMKWSFAVCAVMCLGGVFASLARGKMGRSGERAPVAR
jgi:EmrB/QacA subfamily drug resistance transporter